VTYADQLAAVLRALAAAPSRQLNVRTIARKLSIKPSEAIAMCLSLKYQSKIERVLSVMRETPTDSSWHLKVTIEQPSFLPCPTCARDMRTGCLGGCGS